jgi:hypothetical protein
LRQQLDDLDPDIKAKILTDEVQRVPKLLDVVHPLTYGELYDDFNPQWVLAYGSLPKIRIKGQCGLWAGLLNEMARRTKPEVVKAAATFYLKALRASTGRRG